MGGTNDKYIVSSRATSRECDYESIARRLLAIDPNEGRCIVENTMENIEYFHVLPREAMDNDNLMDSLEWSWNLRRGELNLDTCYNILPVSPSVKAKLESREWMLIPEEETVSDFRDAIVVCMGMEYRRHNFPTSSPNKIYKYKLVPVLESDESVTLRLNNPMDPDNTTAHKYPYNEFPTLYSHVRPEFVIAEAGYNILVRKDAGMAKLSSSIHGTVDSFSECGTSESSCYSETVTTPSIQYSKKRARSYSTSSDCEPRKRSRLNTSDVARRKLALDLVQTETEDRTKRWVIMHSAARIRI